MYYAEVTSGSVPSASKWQARGEKQCCSLTDVVIVTWHREIFEPALLKMVTFSEMRRGGVNYVRQMGSPLVGRRGFADLTTFSPAAPDSSLWVSILIPFSNCHVCLFNNSKLHSCAGSSFLMNFVETSHGNYKLHCLNLLYFISNLFPSVVSIGLNIVVYLSEKLRSFF